MYRTLFYAGLILAIAFLIAAVVLFFVLKIPRALGVVTGRTQKRAIEEIRAGGIEARTKRESRRGSEKRIHVREVEMDTGSLNKTGKTGTMAAQQAAQQAAVRDAARDMQTATTQVDLETGSTVGRTMKDRSKAYEETEVLGFTGSLNGDGVGAKTEAETDVLGGQNSGPQDEEETDVLSSGSESQMVGGGTVRMPDYSPEMDEETDVLSTGPRPAQNRDMETDVLLSGTSVPEDANIVGRYSAEETAVLRSIHTETEPVAPDSREIRVLYSETIVHTEESL